MNSQDKKFNDTISEIRTEAQVQEAIRDIELTIRNVKENPGNVLQAAISSLSSLCTSACFSSLSSIEAKSLDAGNDDALARIHEQSLSDI